MSVTDAGLRQRRQALEHANARRTAGAELRRDLRTGRLSLGQVLHDPPPALSDVPLVDVVRLARATRSPTWFTRLGRVAAQDGVNLLMPLGQASVATRSWLARHAAWYARRRQA